MWPPSNTALDREIGLRGGLRAFVDLAWPQVDPSPLTDNWHLGAICSALEDVYHGRSRNLLVNVPPGCTKSKLTQVFFPVWVWIQDPSKSFMSTSFDMKLTLRDAGESLALIQSPWFRDRWGDRVQIVGKAPGVGDHETIHGGFRFSTSIGGKATGRHPDFKVIDDANKPEEDSPEAFEKVHTWHSRTWASRGKDPRSVANVVIAQRLHENDLCGYLLGKGGYRHLCLPMEWDPELACPEDPRTTKGDLLWPSRFPRDVVEGIRATAGSRVYAAQYGQRPTPEAGQIFKREHLHFWSTLPSRWDLQIQSWDCSFKDTDGSDYVAGQVWGRAGGRFYLLDRFCQRTSFTGTLAEIQATRRKWPRATAILVEDKANGTAVIEVLSKDIPGIVPVNPEGGKVARANAVSPLFEAGNVFLPDPEANPWVEGYLQCLLGFPFAKHDDEVDATTQALLYLHQKGSSFGAAMDRLRGKPG